MIEFFENKTFLFTLKIALAFFFVASQLFLLFILSSKKTSFNFCLNFKDMLLVFVFFLIILNMPITSNLVIINFETGVLFVLFLLFLGVFHLFSQQNANFKITISLLAQTIVLAAILPCSILASGLNLKNIVLSQSSDFLFFGWYFIPLYLSLILFAISIFVQKELFEDNILQKVFLLCSSSLFVVLFLGGFLPPNGEYIAETMNLKSYVSNFYVNCEQFLWFFVKTFLVFLFFQSINLTFQKPFKALCFFALPLCLVNFFMICYFKYFSFWGI